MSSSSTCKAPGRARLASALRYRQKPLHSCAHPLRLRDTVFVAKRHTWRRHALEIDFSDPDVLLALAGAIVGIGIGIGVPVFIVSRDKLDEERVEALRELNRETYEATGEYLSKEELAKIRPPRWTDRREFKDDD